MRASG
jgi:hypothetical protein